MKGILLAGGNGTRLFPLTRCLSKQLLPVYDKPTIYYPLSTLMLGGIKEILLISTPRDLPMIEDLLQDGSQLGLDIQYKEQKEPKGIAEAFLIAEDFIESEEVCLILGDNIFYGQDLCKQVQISSKLKSGAEIYAYHVQDPQRYGVVEFNEKNIVLSLEEKPKNPRSNWAITGLYFYDQEVVRLAKTLKPSKRGELEITDLNRAYLREGNLRITQMGRGTAWLDSGTYDSLLSASQFIQTLEKRQGFKVACLEEIAYQQEWINKQQLEKLTRSYPRGPYRDYLESYLKESTTRF